MTSHESAGLLGLLAGRSGHFQLESGHHGELWLDLDTFLLRPALLSPYVEVLARRLAETAEIEGICGRLLGGALIASALATTLDRDLYVAEPAPPAEPPDELFRARYTVPPPVRTRLAGQRVAVVDDVVNAGSATRATVADLRAAGATVVAIGAMLVLGDRAPDYAEREGVRLSTSRRCRTASGCATPAHCVPRVNRSRTCAGLSMAHARHMFPVFARGSTRRHLPRD